MYVETKIKEIIKSWIEIGVIEIGVRVKTIYNEKNLLCP